MSKSNPGQGGATPLIPSWLVEDYDIEQPLPPIADPSRFTAPRSDFTRYINSHGSSGSLKRATSNYVRNTLRGSDNAVTRLGSARDSTSRLFSVFSGFVNQGVSETSRIFNLGDIFGMNASEAMLHIMDFVCPNGGRDDDGIARDSYIEAICSLPEWDNEGIESLSPTELLAFIEIYMANVVEYRLLNDIGNKIIILPDDIELVESYHQQIKDFISGAVADAISALAVDIRQINTSQTRSITDDIYRKSYSILESWEGY